ncbi:MAG: molybdopterin biosynthesis protein [Rhodopirellula sp.]|nr:molybdopterin biosynthesis protein [Rhodopirellula sp.]
MSQSRNSQEWRDAVSQKQFLEVISRDEATVRFREHLDTQPRHCESVALAESLRRVLAVDVISKIDVPAFDRSNVDGFAVQAADTAGAMEETPTELTLNAEVLSPGSAPTVEVRAGTATPIATGGMLPRGADAVVMIEQTEMADGVEDAEPGDARLLVFHSAASGQAVTFAGTDIARGETVLRFGQVLTSREIGVLAALGLTSVEVWKKPRVAIVSTGNEIVAPGNPLPTGSVYDSNAAILCAAVEELGCEPVPLGTVRDDVDRLREIIRSADDCDAIVLSGGTSKGAGDLSYQVVSELTNPGIVAHGVTLKPGKPICLAVSDGRPVVVLPGFPTSAVFTFHEFVAPVLREMAGLAPENRQTVQATLPIRMNSERGRTEYSLVSLVRGESGLSAWPMGKGSGSVTTFSLADGFITIDQHTEILDEGSTVSVTLLARELAPADLVVIGSHCVGLDFLLGEMRKRGFTSRVLHVGSMGGVAAAKRGECDIAGVHLMNPVTEEYNRHLLTESLDLVSGYRRSQGVVFRRGDERFEHRTATDAVKAANDDAGCTMINRNPGSGTRVLIDRLLGDTKPPGYNVQTKSHNAVATAVVQGRADWGVAIETVAAAYGLGFLPLRDEHYDFIVPRARFVRPPVVAFRQLLSDPSVLKKLTEMGFSMSPS